MTAPLGLHSAPAAGFDEPVDMLPACHERVQPALQLPLRLGGHLSEPGCDANARQAACDVMRHFDIAGPVPHEVEAGHPFVVLLAEDLPGWMALGRRLHQDHAVRSQAWPAVRDDLQTVSGGRSWVLAPATIGAEMAARRGVGAPR